MTREEAIMYLKRADVSVGCEVKTKTAEAIDMAIKALKQEPCEDCISRSETLSVFRPRGITEDVWKECDVYKKLTALPSVTPKPKMQEVEE